MTMIRVLIVDDHPIIRKGIRDILANVPDIEIIGEAASGEDALKLSREFKPDVLLLDMELGEMSGVQVAQTLQHEGSPVRILALSAHNDREYVQETLKCGAAGYLGKEEMPGLILAAVRGVANGETGWISRQLVAHFTEWQQTQEPHGPQSMSKRESQVLAQVVGGKTNREIGRQLIISEKTVEKHLEAIFRKLKVASRTEAAVWAARQDLDKTKNAINGY